MTAIQKTREVAPMTIALMEASSPVVEPKGTYTSEWKNHSEAYVLPTSLDSHSIAS
jgi:hypothetical protein